jgi:MOSC domain-containing protein YiiM
MLLAQRPADAPPAAIDLPGNNLVVDLRTSEAAMPPGTRIRIGHALIETNDEEHLGCKKFEARFGRAALAWVNHVPDYDLHLRGVYASVIEDGDIAVGDVATIVRASE